MEVTPEKEIMFTTSVYASVIITMKVMGASLSTLLISWIVLFLLVILFEKSGVIISIGVTVAFFSLEFQSILQGLLTAIVIYLSAIMSFGILMEECAPVIEKIPIKRKRILTTAFICIIYIGIIVGTIVLLEGVFT